MWLVLLLPSDNQTLYPIEPRARAHGFGVENPALVHLAYQCVELGSYRTRVSSSLGTSQSREKRALASTADLKRRLLAVGKGAYAR
jgi:hypothetical protein